MPKKYTRNKRQKKYRRRRSMKGGNDSIIENIEVIPSSGETHDLDLDESLHLDQNDLNELHDSFDTDTFSSQGSLHISDLEPNSSLNTTKESYQSIDSIDDSLGLNQSIDSNTFEPLHINDLESSSVNTTMEDNSIGGKKYRKSYKKRHGKKGKKTRKNRRKQKGGVCYGSGVGANNYDPNYSIYNTNMLKLFPYKPIK